MEFNKVLAYTIFLYLGYGLLLYLPEGSVAIPVVIETTEIFWANIPLVTLIDLFITPIYMIFMLHMIRKAIIEHPMTENSKPIRRKKDLVKILFYYASILLVTGVVMHAVANVLNGVLGDPVPPSGNLQILIYLFDEVLGHKLIHIGLYGFIVGLMILQFWHRYDPELKIYTKISLYVWPALIGCIYSLAGAEGQAAFDIIIISSVLIGSILVSMVKKGLKLRENVFIHFILVFSISIIVTLIIYGCLTGFLPGYPFFLQPPFT
ncbi:MAG: hypothetical protein ACTSQI_02475 [Candidatus Helarchaeota archaeon]